MVAHAVTVAADVDDVAVVQLQMAVVVGAIMHASFDQNSMHSSMVFVSGRFALPL